MNYAIITGGGTGLGKALAVLLAKTDLSVLIVGRTKTTLQTTQSLAPSKIQFIEADISNEEGQELVVAALPKGAQVSYLIHNATAVSADLLKNISLKSWREQMAVNLEAPLLLTQKILPLMQKGRILHISSGFAHIPAHGIAPYCIGKAALHMLYKCLDLELKDSGVRVGSLKPGIIDTPLQDKFRSLPMEIFTARPKFQEFKEKNQLQTPEKVARFVEWVLLKTSDQKFAENEWSIGDEWHQKEWL